MTDPRNARYAEELEGVAAKRRGLVTQWCDNCCPYQPGQMIKVKPKATRNRILSGVVAAVTAYNMYGKWYWQVDLADGQGRFYERIRIDG